MAKSASSDLIKISKFISALFNPMNSLILYFVLHSFQRLSLKEALENFLSILLIIVVPISSWIFYNVKTKKYTDTDVSDRKQRISLYFFITGAIIAYLTFIYFRYGIIDFVLLFLLLLLIVLQISNYFIKSSMHTALNVFVAALMFTLNPIYGIIWLILTVAVACSRIILKRHTLAEVLSGAVIASIVSFIYLYTPIQN